MKSIPLDEQYIYQGCDQVDHQNNPDYFFNGYFPDNGTDDKQVKTKFTQGKKIVQPQGCLTRGSIEPDQFHDQCQ